MLFRPCPASVIIRILARLVGPVKLGPRTVASSVGVSVRAHGRFPS